jgi:hypothetical protein
MQSSRPSTQTGVAAVGGLDECTIEECQAFVQRPHRSWDSALKEMARAEAAAERLRKARSETGSNSSSVSAYSVASIRSTMSMRSQSSVKSRSSAVGQPHSPQLPIGELSVGGLSIVGGSAGGKFGAARQQRAHPSSAPPVSTKSATPSANPPPADFGRKPEPPQFIFQKALPSTFGVKKMPKK